jgi:hypothetical protein
MAEVKSALARQAEWQRLRARLAWPEKIRQAELLRDALLAWRGHGDSQRSKRPTQPGPAGAAEPPPTYHSRATR